jgi:arylsulfatase A
MRTLLFFTLGDDPGESKNLAAEHADDATRLRTTADRMKEGLGLDGTGPGCRPLGKVQKAAPIIGPDGKVREGLGEGTK